jgi:hypothetical protein
MMAKSLLWQFCGEVFLERVWQPEDCCMDWDWDLIHTPFWGSALCPHARRHISISLFLTLAIKLFFDAGKEAHHPVAQILLR